MVATVAAFFVTQHLKVTTPVIAGVSHPPPLRPGPTGCRGVRNQTHVSFYLLHQADYVSVSVVDHDGVVIRQLAANVRMVKPAPGNHARRAFYWNGRRADGSLPPDGTYLFRVTLRQQRRDITLTAFPITLTSHASSPCRS